MIIMIITLSLFLHMKYMMNDSDKDSNNDTMPIHPRTDPRSEARLTPEASVLPPNPEPEHLAANIHATAAEYA